MSEKSARLTIEEIKRRRRVVCICRAIPQGRIEDAIRMGCASLEAVRKKTGAGTGDCGGRRCGPVVLELLENTSAPAEETKGPDSVHQ